MLRALLLDRSALILVILTMPASMAAAGPIFTQPIQTAGASPWVQGSTGVNPMAWSATGLSGVAPGAMLWVDLQLTRPGHDLFAPSQVDTAASGVGNPPVSPAASAPVSAAESSAASRPANGAFVPVSPSANGIDVSGHAINGPSVAAAPSTPSNQGFVPGQPSTSPGSPSSYQASPTGYGDSRSTRLAGGPTNSIATSQAQMVPSTGGATGSTNPGTSAIPASGVSTPPK